MWKKYKKCKNKICTNKTIKEQRRQEGGLMLEFLLQYNNFSRGVHYLPFPTVEFRRKSILL